VVHAVVLARVLDAHHVTNALHHADGGMVAGLVGTQGANLPVRDHPAFPAVADFVPEPVDGLREVMDILLRLPKEVKSQPKGAATPHPGKGADGFDRVGQEFGRIFLFIGHGSR
jgi:hypothetical protein